MQLRTVIPATALLFLLQSTGIAQQRYELRPRFAPGQRWAIERLSTFEMSNTVLVDDMPVERFRQSRNDRINMQIEFLEIADGAPRAVRVTFGDECGSTMQQADETQREAFPGAGKTFAARRQPDGSVAITPDTSDDTLRDVMTDMLEVDLGAYPRQPLAVGESWQWTPQSVAGTFDLSEGDEGSVNCTLKGVSQRDGRSVAEIEFAVTLERGSAEEGPDQRIATLLNATLNGRGALDVETGQLLELDLAGDATLGGLIYGRNEAGELEMQADLDGEGRITMKTRSRPVGNATNAIAVTTLSNTPEPSNADWIGTYANERITLELTSASADGITGSLEFDGRENPVRGQATGDVFRGQFQSDQNWFDFELTRSGDTETLSTGGAAHTLQIKRPARNPLGGEARPANPLGGGRPAPNPLSQSPGTTAITPAGAQPARTRTESNIRPSASRTQYSVYQCLDEQGFRDPQGRPLEVFRMLIPQGWRFRGGVTWKINQKGALGLDRADLVNPAVCAFQIAAPDESVVIEAYPEVRFADIRESPAYQMGAFPDGSNYGGVVVAPAVEPDVYITSFVIPQQRGIANVRIVESKPQPAVAQRYEHEAAIINRCLGAAGIGSAVFRAAHVTVDYEWNGRPVRESFLVSLMYLQTPGITMWWPQLNVSLRAPRASFDEYLPVAATCLTSFQPNLRWIAEYLRLQKQAEGVIIDVDRVCREIDREITANRAETNLQIHRDMYPRLAPYCDHLGADGKRYFLSTELDHQMDEHGNIRSDISLPDEAGWTRMPEYTKG